MRLRNLSPRRDTRHAQDVYSLPPALFAIFAPETIARRCGVCPPSIWMEDSTRVTRDARKSTVRQWGRWDPAPHAPLTVLVLRYNGCGVRVRGAKRGTRRGTRVTGHLDV